MTQHIHFGKIEDHVNSNLELTKLRLDPELLEDQDKLCTRLETAYLQGGQYRLAFPRKYLTTVENLFDSIIARHGIRQVNFEYELLAGEFESFAFNISATSSPKI